MAFQESGVSKILARFGEIVEWWNKDLISNQISPHFFLYPAEMMIEKGFDVEVLTKFSPIGNEKLQEKNNSINVFRASRPTFPFLLLRHMLKKDYFLIHMHSLSPMEQIMVWILSRIRRIPVVYTSHWIVFPERFGSQTSKYLSAAIYNVLLRIGDWRLGAFTAFTEFQAEIYRRYGIRNVHVIPHGFDLQVFEAPKNPHAEAKFEAMAHNILCVGVISPRKGQLLLVRGMSKIIKEYPSTRLFLVGRAFGKSQIEYEKKLKLEIQKRKLEKNVSILENVGKEDLVQLYLMSDLFALPTEFEAFALVFLEAMAAGLPIVSTDFPPMNRILRNWQTALLVKREEEMVTEAILTLLGDSGLRRRLGWNAKQEVKQKYGLDKVKKEYWNLYGKLSREAAGCRKTCSTRYWTIASSHMPPMNHSEESVQRLNELFHDLSSEEYPHSLI